jgi:glycosyltransferase involved in cell wall biosynthesis
MAAMRDELSEPTIAIFPWGDVIEEFLDPIGLTVEDFVNRMSGGWLFGYVTALQYVGWRPIIVFGSENKNATTRLIHAATGVPVWLVPSARVVNACTPITYNAAYSIRRWLATPLRMFRDVIEREQCRSIMIQEYEYTSFDALVRLAIRLGICAFATFQGGDRTLSWIERLVRGRSLGMCSGLIIASGSERLRVERRYAGRHPPIANIPNPIDSQEWQAIDRREARSLLGLRQDLFIAINHGRIDIRRKGLDVLLEAWAAAHGGTSRAAFVLLLPGANR